jgi:adenylyltransferase/sulfurtransferase
VLGVLPGVIGTLQATEAIKLLLGIGEPLVGRLLTYDALTAEFSTLRFGRNPACPACGDPEHRPRLVDYDASCRVPGI